MEPAPPETREFSTGYVIAGAYADKVRRTLFAQLRDLIRQDKEFSKEIARASAELNIVLYRILVDELKTDKGDLIRARISYTLDQKTKRIIWDYKTLRVEVFRRIPDNQVAEVVNDIISNRLSKILEEFKIAPQVAEAAVRAFEVSEEKLEEERTRVIQPPTIHVLKPSDIIGAIIPLGETIDGGLLFKINDKNGRSIGLASVTPSGDELVIDAIVIQEGVARRYLSRTRGSIRTYQDSPEMLTMEIDKASPTELSREQADGLIREKMLSLM
ncbi:MAG: DUF2258 domain-containing protein [Desulfurococcaceae archaeon]